jgi:hypothetical protein
MSEERVRGQGDLKRFANAVRRAGLTVRRASVGQEGWSVTSKRPGSAVVVWRRGAVLGEILLTSRLEPSILRDIAGRYAAVSDAHIANLLSLGSWERTLARVRPDGTVPRDVALDLFAIAYAPLPGTRRPSGPSGSIEDGMLAAREILRIWQTLSRPVGAAASCSELPPSSSERNGPHRESRRGR